MEEDHIERNKAGCKAEYRGDDDGFTVRFHRHCGEGWGTGVSANVPHGGTHDEEKIRESSENLSISLRSLQRIINAMDELHYVGSGNHGHWEIKHD